MSIIATTFLHAWMTPVVLEEVEAPGILSGAKLDLIEFLRILLSPRCKLGMPASGKGLNVNGWTPSWKTCYGIVDCRSKKQPIGELEFLGLETT